MTTKLLSFSYKESRNYIQGPDILNSILNELQSMHGNLKMTQLKFSISKMTSRNLIFIAAPGHQMAEPDAVAVLTYNLDNIPHYVKLIEDTHLPTSKLPYDEQSLINMCIIDTATKTILLNSHSSPFSMVESVVSMNKALHHHLFPNIKGKWVFCKWESDYTPTSYECGNISVVMAGRLGTRLTYSDIYLSKTRIGRVYFSLKG